MSQRNKKAFTLIELLIVIAIIGILSSVVLVKLTVAREKARDAARLKSIKSIQSALEVYYANYGRYPRSANCGASIPNVSWCNSVQSQNGSGHWIKDNGLVAFSGASDPVDPGAAALGSGMANSSGVFFYYGTSTEYMIVFRLENRSSTIQSQDGYRNCADTTTYHYGNGSDGIITWGKCATK